MKQSLLLMLILVLAWPWVPAQAHSEGPDERVLWQLFNAGRLQLLRQAIAEYRQRYPGWTPPAELTRLLEADRRSSDSRRKRIEAAIRSENRTELIRLAQRYPQSFDCRQLGFLRALALAHARTGAATAAWKRYREALVCPGAPSGDILAEALWHLPPPIFRKLLQSVRETVPPSVYADLDYQSQRRQLIEAHQRRDWQEFGQLAGPLLESAADRRDLDLISLAAWAWFDRKEWQRAIPWFKAGLKLAPDNEDLASGLLTSYTNLGQDEEVLALIDRGFSARLRQQAGDYLLARAWTLYQQGDYTRSRVYAERALPWLANPASADHLLGWLDLQTGHHEGAQHRFERLYRTHPNRTEYAEALVLSYLRAGVDPDRLAARFPQPMIQTLLTPYRAQRHYDRQQFLSAYQVNPGAFPQLEHIDRPAWEAAALYRFKSGNGGLDRLHTVIAPLYEGSYVTGTQRFDLHSGLIVLQSGRLVGAGIRALQASGDSLTDAQQNALERETGQLRQDLPTQAVEAALVKFSYRREGPFNPYFQLGLTPLGGPLAPRPTLRLGVFDWLMGNDSPSWQLHWGAEGYSQPVRQSLLSYTGWKLLGNKWGRVMRSGLKLSGLLQMGAGWSVYQSLDTAFLDGQRTKDNWTVSYTLAPGYDFRFQGFDYFTIGPYFSFMHYGNNQNHFRLGHGGYFSPQAFYSGGVQLNLRTREGKKFLLESSLAAGIQHFRERAEPWFPRGCSGQEPLLCNLAYPANRETDFAPSGRVRWVLQIHPHLQLTGGVYARKTGGYKEIGAGIFLRFLFDSRQAVFSTDLPGFLFDAIE